MAPGLSLLLMTYKEFRWTTLHLFLELDSQMLRTRWCAIGRNPQGLLSAPLWKYGVCICACVYYTIPIGPLSNTINKYLREYVVNTGKTLIFLELPPTAYLIWSMDFFFFLEHLSICAHGAMIVLLLICTYGRVYMCSILPLLQLINSLIPFLLQIFSQSREHSHYSLPPS